MMAARNAEQRDELHRAAVGAALPDAARAAPPFAEHTVEPAVLARSSAPNALTTGLQLKASARAPPTRVSQAFASRAAGAT